MNKRVVAMVVVLSAFVIPVTPADAKLVFDNGVPSKSGGFLSDVSLRR